MTNDSLTPPTTRFRTPVGEIVGWPDGDVVRATGIPYARAHRFEMPQPVSPASEVIEATTWAPACPQNSRLNLDDLLGGSMADFPIDEDCLRLSATACGVVGRCPPGDGVDSRRCLCCRWRRSARL